MTLVHRATVALLSTALAVSLAASAAPTEAASVSPTSPAGTAATWSAHQLTKGLIHNRQYDFDDYGSTLDTGFALLATGGHQSSVTSIRSAMTHHVPDYTTFASSATFTHVSSGAIAKLLVFAQRTGGGAANFGGTNLVQALDARVGTTGPTKGRISDVFDPTDQFDADYANTLGQAYAVRGLLAAHDPLAKSALNYLMLRQCGQGFFSLDLGQGPSSAKECKPSKADNDATALVLSQLWQFRNSSPELIKGLPAAAHWLTSQEAKNGAVAEVPGSAPDANSSGYAAWALGTAGQCKAAAKAASYVATLQLGGGLQGTKLAGQRGAIAVDKAALTLGRHQGITKDDQANWRSATAQAAPGLVYLGGKNCK